MIGYDAVTDAAILAGCRFFAGYPITPATEIAERMAEKLPKSGGIFLQMEDELASINSLIGASWAGFKAMTATSGPGLSLMMEGLGYAVLSETPMVIVDVQRVGPSTGMVTYPSQGDVCQVRWGSHGDYSIIAIAPASVQDSFDYTIMAFNYAELYRTPVILLMDEVIAHLREPLIVREDVEIVKRKRPSMPPEEFMPFMPKPGEYVQREMPALGEGYKVIVESTMHDELGYRESESHEVGSRTIARLWNKIEKNVEKIAKEEFYFMEDAEIAVVSYGCPFRSAINAAKTARKEGINVGVVKMITIWPFHDSMIEKLAEKVKAIVVPEMNMSKIVREVARAAKGKAKVLGVPKLAGQMHTPEDILVAIRSVAR